MSQVAPQPSPVNPPVPQVAADATALQRGIDAYDNGDYSTAKQIFTILADLNELDAQNKLGVMHLLGRGATKDSKIAFKWFELAAKQGYSPAQSNLGLMYSQGNGVVKQDKGTALKWYTLAAKQGYPQAQLNLALLYYHGKGVPQDYQVAFDWCTKSADQDCKPAQYNLGVMYYNGDGVPKDYVLAYKWFNLAATSNGDTKAAYQRDRLALHMTASQIDKAQDLSRKWVANQNATNN